jgi:hypothetical protein
VIALLEIAWSIATHSIDADERLHERAWVRWAHVSVARFRHR